MVRAGQHYTAALNFLGSAVVQEIAFWTKGVITLEKGKFCTLRIAVMLLGILVGPTVAQASTLFNSESDFLAAAPTPLLLEQFNNPGPSGTFLDYGTFSFADAFTGHSPRPLSANGGTVVNWGSGGAGNPLTISLDQPASAVGFQVLDFGDFGPGTLRITSNVGDDFLVATTSGSGGGIDLFVGIVDLSGQLRELQLHNSILRDVISIENFRHNVSASAPGVSALLAFGLALVFAKGRSGGVSFG